MILDDDIEQARQISMSGCQAVGSRDPELRLPGQEHGEKAKRRQEGADGIDETDAPVVGDDAEHGGGDATHAESEPEEDAGDQNLPLMVWYAAEPLPDIDMTRALTLALESKLPQTFSFMVQRIASARTPEALRVLAERLVRTENPARQAELIKGLNHVISPAPVTVR